MLEMLHFLNISLDKLSLKEYINLFSNHMYQIKKNIILIKEFKIIQKKIKNSRNFGLNISVLPIDILYKLSTVNS